MYPILVELDAFEPSVSALSERALERCVEHILEGLSRVNQEILAVHNLPPIYESGVTYWDDSRDRHDRFRDALRTLRAGRGDCDDLVPWRVAELRLSDIAARPVVLSERGVGSRLYHTVVRWPDGRTEDPSKNLGMEI